MLKLTNTVKEDQVTENKLFDLSGRVSLITGAGSGIGRTICEAVAEFGSNVVCADIRQDWAEETAQIVSKHGVKAIAAKADVSQQDQVKAMFSKADREFGKLDILVNNAAIATKSALLHEMSLEDWNKVISVDLTGVFLCLQEGIKLMLRQKKGSIINIASILGLIGMNPEILATSNYVAAKHGVIGLTKKVATEYGSSGIRANAIAPGFFVGTRLAEIEKRTDEQHRKVHDEILKLTPMNRTATTSELKGIAVYLASDASSFVTGTTTILDGGWCAW
jgi:NAD(P)-dependent dehydrogenase (short-subunit alcohol dehydrogenase family)